MKFYIRYIRLEAKRMLLSLPSIFGGSFFLLLLLSGLFGIFYVCQTDDTADSLPVIGVVAPEEEPLVDWMISTVSQMENAKNAFRFERVTREDGQRRLQNGDINVIFEIPEGYIRSIVNGSNKHVTIRFAKGQTTIVSFLIREVSKAASSFILNTEAALYSLQDYYASHGLPNMQKEELKLNIQFIREIAGLEQAIEPDIAEAENAYSLPVTYTASGIVLLLFLWGLTCAKMLTSQSSAFQNQLFLEGIRTGKQILARGAAFFAVCLINFLLFLSIGAAVLLIGKLPAGDMILASPAGILRFAVGMLPVLFLSSSFILMIYEAVSDTLGGILFLFFSVLIMGLCSGCFYPIDYLPEAIRNIAGGLPVRRGLCYTMALLCGETDTSSLLYLLFDTFLCYFLCILCRSVKRRIAE